MPLADHSGAVKVTRADLPETAAAIATASDDNQISDGAAPSELAWLPVSDVGDAGSNPLVARRSAGQGFTMSQRNPGLRPGVAGDTSHLATKSHAVGVLAGLRYFGTPT